MTSSKYNELNPRAELREWYFFHGLCYGKIFFDQKKEHDDGMNVSFVPGYVADYKDHIMTTWNKDVIKLEKKYKRNK